MTHSSSVIYAQIVTTMMFRVTHDGGCYMLPEHQYQHLLACTTTRNRMIEELHILMVRTEVELQHVCRVLADAFQASNPNHDHTLLHDSLVDHIQHVRDLRRQYYTTMLEQNDCSELQFIYRRKLTNQYWTPHQVPTRTRSCPSLRSQRYTFRSLLPFDHVQLRRGSLPIFEPDSE